MEVEGTEDISLNMEPLISVSTEESDASSNLKHRLAADFMAILSSAMEERCFSRCVPKPGVRIERHEERCLMQCMNRFLEAWNITSETVQRVSAKAAGRAQE
jgi:import inner membrane translocase subunit TIM13